LLLIYHIPLRATRPVQRIMLDLIALMTLREAYKL